MEKTTSRYAVRREQNHTWTVYDVFTGLAAKPSTWFLVDLTQDQADTYCAVINAKDAERRRDRG
ncbi:hypothetical protein M8R20_15030 [Pseudomonas sp. R2.Fl]|nr:hypothetical protein [Pseudomonas sp. R2.Fl]